MLYFCIYIIFFFFFFIHLQIKFVIIKFFVFCIYKLLYYLCLYLSLTWQFTMILLISTFRFMSSYHTIRQLMHKSIKFSSFFYTQIFNKLFFSNIKQIKIKKYTHNYYRVSIVFNLLSLINFINIINAYHQLSLNHYHQRAKI